jgi:hypothetical protein
MEHQGTKHTRYPAAPTVRLILKEVDIMQRDDTEHINALLLLAPLAQAHGTTFNGLNQSLILETHVRHDLTEDAPRLDRWRRIYQYAAAAKDVLVQREG